MSEILKYSAIIFIILLSVTQTSFAKPPTPTPTPAPTPGPPTAGSTETFTAGNPFTDNIDFYSTQGSNSYSYYEITDQYSYTFHTQSGLNSSSYVLDGATLSLRQIDNSNSNTVHPYELWFAGSDGNYFIGNLSTSTLDWVTDSWTLSPDVLKELGGPDPWSLTVKLTETTNGDDKLKIDWSTLTGSYSAVSTPTPTPDPTPGGNNEINTVPEPATFVLLGAGLLAVGLARKSIKR